MVYCPHLLFHHAVLRIRVLDVVAVKAWPVEHRLEVPQRDPAQGLAHTRHERGRRSEQYKIHCKEAAEVAFFCSVDVFFSSTKKNPEFSFFSS